MNIDEFNNTFKNHHSKDRIVMNCDCGCGNETETNKYNAYVNISNNGFYICRSCSLKIRHEQNPFSEETKQKISIAATGRAKSLETRAKISKAKKELFQTPHGQDLKRQLSIKASIQHQDRNFLGNHVSGYFVSQKCKQQIYFSSSYELRLLYQLENDENVLGFRSQVAIEVDGKGRCIDVVAGYVDGTKRIFEVKPQNRVLEASNQISDIEQYAISNGYDFKVWTENDSGLANYKEIFNWAMEYFPECTSIDSKPVRTEKRRESANRHYHKNISNDTITYFCDYCKEEHTQLRLTYDKTVSKHGRPICEREGGHISGSKPKPHLRKHNPYAAEGKKECVKCKRILLFELFGLDSSRRDGYSSRCKECRAALAKEKYNQ